MKVILVLVSASLLSATLAQEAAKPQLRSSGPAPVSEPIAPAKSEPLGLIPETLEPAPKSKGTALTEPAAPEQKIDKTTAAEDELNGRIRLRELKTKVEREPQIQGELDRANHAKTDLQKREALKSYYTMLYGKIEKLDPSLKKRIFEARERYLRRLEQTRLAPTEPLEPGERAAAE